MANKDTGLNWIANFLSGSYCHRNIQNESLPIIKEGTRIIVNSISMNKKGTHSNKNVKKVIFNHSCNNL